ncbi:MAG: hypothetical protein H7Y11_04320 [Armatimonadetes bacterium]|nr:hypothetical protein [Anaerolineae bacterium]
MHIRFDWHCDAQDIMLITYNTGWTWDELYPTFASVKTLVQAHPHPVALVNLFTSSYFPRGSAFTHIQHAFKSRSTNIYAYIIVSDSPFITNLGTTIFKILKQVSNIPEIKFVPTIELALKLAQTLKPIHQD